MNRKIIYLINPISGTKGKESLLQKIEQKTLARNIPYEIHYSNPQGNYYFLKEKINTENVTDIVICGGDGTISQVASALIDEDVNIGIIPVGSGNGLAFAAKIPAKADKALDLIFTGKPSYIDSFFINDTFSCMLCGLGFDAQVAHDFARQKKRGLATYLKRTIINFIDAQPFSFDITNKGKSFNTEAFFISIANANQFGNQVTIAPGASLDDGLLDIIIVKKMSKLRVAWAIFRQIRAGRIKEYDEKTFHDKDILYFQTDKLIIDNLNFAPLHIDGDPAHSATKFTIEIIRDAFKLIRPAG